MKRVMVTGNTRGLGLAISNYLTDHEYTVLGFGKKDIDITNQQEIDEKLGPMLSSIDVLVNNAAIAYDGILATQGYGSINSIIATNVVAPIYITKLYIRERLRIGLGGNIINISSIISTGGYKGLAAYSASKGALNSFTLAIAREMGPKFRSNAVLPGYFASDLSKSLNSKKKTQVINRTPAGRLADANDICPLVEFLASDKSAFITGQLIRVDGGFTA